MYCIMCNANPCTCGQRRRRNPLGGQTAAKFQELAALYGASSSIEWDDANNTYTANGEAVGPSVHGLYEWLGRQPGVMLALVALLQALVRLYEWPDRQPGVKK